MSTRSNEWLRDLAQRIQRLEKAGNQVALERLYEAHDPGTIREAMATVHEICNEQTEKGP